MWLALAAAVLIAVWLYSQRAASSDQLAKAVQRASQDSAALDSARARIASRDREIVALTGPSTSVVALNTTGAAAATALMFWDRTDNSWALYAHHLPPPPQGKTYQLWLLTPSSKISAGTFTPAPDSSVEVHATYELHDALKGVAVSEEPSGGAPQPTGRIVIVGTPGPK
jgi:Anti-sigma-K factor rskA